MSEKNHIRDEGDSRKYFFQIPNLIDDLNLSIYAFRLTVTLSGLRVRMAVAGNLKTRSLKNAT